MTARSGLRFTKMHGAGNDFVIIDGRDHTVPITPALAARLADRHRGVGCDQILLIEPTDLPGVAIGYSIWNADGSRAGQCGNGARCVAAWARRSGVVHAASELRMGSPAGVVAARFLGDQVEVDMGVPDFRASSVLNNDRPGRVDAESERYAAIVDDVEFEFGVVSMGNPHALIEVSDVATAPVERWGRALQSDPRFSDSCNVGFAQVVECRRLRLRVFERGVGETLACGSGACAAVAVLARWGRVDSGVQVDLPGGTLHVEWADGSAALRLRGGAEFVFEGVMIA